MNINLEAADKHAVQAYSDTQLQINSTLYHTNLIVCSQGIDPSWEIMSVKELNESALAPILTYQPEVIIIGHNLIGKFPPSEMSQFLSQQGIGLECMSIGAACRTYNVLLSEYRKVVLGIIF